MSREHLDILLVEDDKIDVKNVYRAFEKLKITNPLIVASNGLEALDMLRGTNGHSQVHPALVLLDLNMPRMNGIEFLANLREDAELHSLSVIVLTTSAEQKDIIDAYNFHVAGYIVKPMQSTEFLESVAILNQYWKICEKPSAMTGRC